MVRYDIPALSQKWNSSYNNISLKYSLFLINSMDTNTNTQMFDKFALLRTDAFLPATPKGQITFAGSPLPQQSNILAQIARNNEGGLFGRNSPMLPQVNPERQMWNQCTKVTQQDATTLRQPCLNGRFKNNQYFPQMNVNAQKSKMPFHTTQ